MGLSKKAIAIALAGLVVTVAAISPALGGPSLKKLIRKEVRKQLRTVTGQPGPAGTGGAAGTSFDANATLPSGQTLTGVWLATGAGESGGAALISFTPQLPNDLGAGAVHRVGAATPPTGPCPGQGSAAAGHFCLYERDTSLTGFQGIFNPASGAPGANRRGVQIGYTDNAGIAVGTWAVTAP